MTPDGAPSRVLRIDLASRTTRVEEVEGDLLRQPAGGSLLAAYLLLHQTPSHLPEATGWDASGALIRETLARHGLGRAG